MTNREDETWDDWQEVVEEPCKCLFCPELLPSVAASLSHCSTTHDFDLRRVIKSSGMPLLDECLTCKELDFYASIKLVNFIRKSMELNQCVYCCLPQEDISFHLREEGHYKVDMASDIWRSDAYGSLGFI